MLHEARKRWASLIVEGLAAAGSKHVDSFQVLHAATRRRMSAPLAEKERVSAEKLKLFCMAASRPPVFQKPGDRPGGLRAEVQRGGGQLDIARDPLFTSRVSISAL